MRWWQGYVLVELSGYGMERLLNMCSHHQISLWNVICSGQTYCFCVAWQDVTTLADLVRKSRCRLVILEKNGFPFWVRTAKMRGFLIAGVLLFFGLLYGMSFPIWQMEFSGNSYFTEEMLRKTLANHGYFCGMWKGNVVCEELEMLLREIYPEITWVSAQIQGTCLSIQIRENQGIQVMDVSKEEPCDLVAASDGVITQMITREGTPLVKVGDTVSKGQVLIRGVVELFNDSKEKTGERSVQADADVWVETSWSCQDRFSMEYPVKWYTGTKQYGITLCLGENRWHLDLGDKQNMVSYDTVTVEKEIPFLGQVKLPIFWQWSVYREYEEFSGRYSQKEAETMAEENCAEIFENLLEKGVQIIEKNVRIDTMGDECVTEVQLLVVQNIAEPFPMDENLQDQEDITN